MITDTSPRYADCDNTLLRKILTVLNSGGSVPVGAGVASFNGRSGVVNLTTGDVTGALGYTPENSANKSTDGTFAANSDTLYPSQKAAKTYVDNAVAGAGAGVYVLKTGDSMSGNLTFTGPNLLITSSNNRAFLVGANPASGGGHFKFWGSTTANPKLVDLNLDATGGVFSINFSGSPVIGVTASTFNVQLPLDLSLVGTIINLPAPVNPNDAATKAYADTKQAADADLTALAALATTGLAARTAANTWSLRTLTGTTNQVNIANGDGVSGNPTFTLPQSIATSSTPQFARLGLGAAADANHTLLLSGGIVATDKHLLDAAVSWNSGATAFTAIKLNVTDTASGAGSVLLNLQVGGFDQFVVGKSGNVTAVGSGTFASSQILLNADGSASFAATSIALNADGSAYFNSGSTLIDSAGGLSIGGGATFLYATGDASFAGGATIFNADGSCSLASAAITISAAGDYSGGMVTATKFVAGSVVIDPGSSLADFSGVNLRVVSAAAPGLSALGTPSLGSAYGNSNYWMTDPPVWLTLFDAAGNEYRIPAYTP